MLFDFTEAERSTARRALEIYVTELREEIVKTESPDHCSRFCVLRMSVTQCVMGHRHQTVYAPGGALFAVAANFMLGALMCVGIGNYAPTMVLLGLLGMHPIAAYPVMIGSDGVLIPVASLGFFRSGRFTHGPAVGLPVGVVGILSAFPLVNAIAAHLTLMRWLVIIVIIFAAEPMLRSAYIPSGRAASTLTE